MKLAQVELVPSPLGPRRVRLTGEVSYATAGRPSEQIWFDVDESIGTALSETGNPGSLPSCRSR